MGKGARNRAHRRLDFLRARGWRPFYTDRGILAWHHSRVADSYPGGKDYTTEQALEHEGVGTRIPPALATHKEH